ncbi:MAG: fibronectin type III domain-containing protein [Sulfurospirillaceae bacterium]|nr:fibronectin type III domain-containing protein [Sulfurospirillaceae bacterium]
MKTFQSRNKVLVSMVAMLFVVLFGIMASGCGGGGDSTTQTVEAPGMPTNFTVVATPSGGALSATLSWSAPTTGGNVTSYEIYRSTTAANIFDPANHLISLPATTHEFIDNAGLERGVTTYWIVAAKNAGGETTTLPQSYTPPGGGAGEVVTYGNNFAAAVIFADGYGIGGLPIDGNWTENNLSLIDYNTSLRPSVTEASTLTEFPYFDENTTFVLDGVTYYKQKTASTWQGEWKNGAGTPQHVTATWGDNLISQTLNTQSIIRIEMVLTETLDTNMTSYKMVSLYGTKDVEIYGTDKTTYETNTSFVFATNAHLRIEEVDANGTVGATVVDQTLFDSTIPDGPGKFAAEINVAGNLTYGYVWDLKQHPVPAGTYRITFLLDNTSMPTGTFNNTYIDNVTVPVEGDPTTFPVLDSTTSTHIDITIHQ